MSNSVELNQIPLAGTKKGIISIAKVSEPYGAGSDDVVSIGIALNGVDVEWKTHIPFANLHEVIAALQAANS
ncbi:MAG: hypothetical protein U9N30_07345 [Campylobacterota bacterium]|nr:hypothetical protein [Campylobacterota bacterium]